VITKIYQPLKTQNKRNRFRVFRGCFAEFLPYFSDSVKQSLTYALRVRLVFLSRRR
jgi:hypothetical protein